ncbi:MAG: hypothetical protein ACPGR8_13520 [Limisphaerales bacterium]
MCATLSGFALIALIGIEAKGTATWAVVFGVAAFALHFTVWVLFAIDDRGLGCQREFDYEVQWAFWVYTVGWVFIGMYVAVNALRACSPPAATYSRVAG